MLKFAITNPRTLLLGVIAEPLKFQKQCPIPSVILTPQARVMLTSSGQLSQSAGSERKEKSPTSQSCLAIQGFISYQCFIERGGGGGGGMRFPPPGKVSPLQVLKKYCTANGMQVADFMWMKLLIKH